ncbi:hypothetical protein Ciccas_005738 [Cichlidogyrus casuarinus]|uniref:Uncharacterized protein n=1 Tax=Cichlidogyrus casuarinus TaxID=1844966 RepID=A0ABD2Q7U9_9PLAT
MGDLIHDYMIKPTNMGEEKKELVGSFFDMRSQGSLLSEITTNYVIKREYVMTDKGTKKRMLTTEPNLRSILSGVYAGEIGNVMTIYSHMILIRKVKFKTTNSDKNSKAQEVFYEPVYVVIKKKGSSSTRSTQGDGKQDDVSTAGVFKDKENPVHIAICAIIKEDDTDYEHIRTFTANIANIPEALMQIWEYVAASGMSSLDDLNCLKKKYPDFIDRGTSMMISFTDGGAALGYTEYSSEMSITKKAFDLAPRSATEKKQIRWCSPEKTSAKRDYAKKFKIIKKAHNDWSLKETIGISRKEGTTTIEEEITQPNTQEIVKQLLANFGSQADSIDKPMYVSKPLRLFTICQVSIINEETKELLTSGQIRNNITCTLEKKSSATTNFHCIKNADALEKVGKIQGLYGLNKKSGETEGSDRKIKRVSDKTVDEYLNDTEKASLKEIRKFIVIDEEWKINAELELKSQIFSNKNIEAMIGEDKYPSDFEGELKAHVTNVEETPVYRKVEHVSILKSDRDKAIKIEIMEPNPKAVLLRRIIKNSKSFLNGRQPIGVVDNLFEKVTGTEETFANVTSSSNSKDAYHNQKSCEIACYGGFMIESQVKVSTVRHTLKDFVSHYEENPVANYVCIKIVQCLCERCENAPVIVQGSDRVSDCVCFTIPSQLLSPMDVNYALSTFVSKSKCAYSKNDFTSVEARFKMRLQRCMNYGLNYVSTKSGSKSESKDEESCYIVPGSAIEVKSQISSGDEANLRDKIIDIVTEIQQITCFQSQEKVLNQSIKVQEASMDMINNIKNIVCKLTLEVNQSKAAGKKDIKVMVSDAIQKLKNDFAILSTELNLDNLIQKWSKPLLADKDSMPTTYKDKCVLTSYFEAYKAECKQCKEVNRYRCGFECSANDCFIQQADGFKPISTMDYLNIRCVEPGAFKRVFSLNAYTPIGCFAPKRMLINYGGSVVFQLGAVVKPEHLGISDNDEWEPVKKIVDPEQRNLKNGNKKDEEKAVEDLSFENKPDECHVTLDVVVTKCGRILNAVEKECSVAPEVERDLTVLNDIKGIIKDSKLKKRINSVGLVRKEYESKDGLSTVEVEEPNIETLIRDIAKTDGSLSHLLVSDFIILREVTLKKLDKQEEDSSDVLIVEPIYVRLKPKKTSSEEQATTNDKEKVASGTNTYKEAVSREIEVPEGKYPHIRVFYYDNDFSDHQYISSLCLRSDNIKEDILALVRNMLLDSAFKEISNNSLEMFPKIWDRGIYQEIQYCPKNKCLLYITEYETKSSLATKVKTCLSITKSESCLIRYSSDRDQNKVAKFEFKTYTDDGFIMSIDTRFEDNSKKIVYEEIYHQPSMKAILDWILDSPGASKYTGKTTLIQKRSITFFISRKYFCIMQSPKSDDSGGEETASIPICSFKIASELVRVTLTSCKEPEDAVDVSKIRDEYSQEMLKCSGVFRLCGNVDDDQAQLSIVYKTSKAEDELKQGFDGFQSVCGKDILSFCLYNDHATMIADMELKSQLVNKIKPKNAYSSTSGKVVGSYPADSEDKAFISTSSKITETPNYIKVQKCGLLTDTRAILVEVVAPNPIAIIWRRMQDVHAEDSTFLKMIEWDPTDFKVGDCKKKKSQSASTGLVDRSGSGHAKNELCAYSRYGTYAAYVHVTVSLLVMDATDNSKVEEVISKREELKLVKCLCLGCTKAQSVLDNGSFFSDSTCYTIPSQISSPLDIREAIDDLVEATQRTICAKRQKHILKRFHHRLQRCMMHGVKSIKVAQDAGSSSSKYNRIA